MGIIDIICYLGLLILLFVMIRVGTLDRVRLNIAGQRIPGVILRSRYRLNSRVGLLNTPRLAAGDGIILGAGRRIHTIGMHFPIDVIFADEAWRILEWREGISPGQRNIKGPVNTKFILELGAGTISQFLPGIKLNQTVEVERCSSI